MTTAEQDRFARIVAVILRHEGGYVNNPADPGGETKYGISKKWYPYLDIKNLTAAQAIDIYYRNWYLKLQLDKLTDERVATKTMDMAVNMGAVNGVRILQTSLIERGHDIDATGRMNDETIVAANKADAEKLLAVMRRRHARHYTRLIEATPALAVFEKGWMNRANA